MFQATGMNRTVMVFLGFCFLLLIAIIFLIISINRPGSIPEENAPSPTPHSASQRDTPQATPYQVVGESGFTPEESRSYLEVRKQADQAYAERKRRMPFITKLPHSTSHYGIEISASSDTITITTVGPESFQASYREEALTWIRQNGGNPETLTIRYAN